MEGLSGQRRSGSGGDLDLEEIRQDLALPLRRKVSPAKGDLDLEEIWIWRRSGKISLSPSEGRSLRPKEIWIWRRSGSGGDPARSRSSPQKEGLSGQRRSESGGDLDLEEIR